MKLWVDNRTPAPEGYIWAKSVNEAISWLVASEKCIAHAQWLRNQNILDRNFASISECYSYEERWTVEVIDLGYCAGSYASDGGDYIEILYWLERNGRSYPIRLHSQYTVGIHSMRTVIQRNGWQEICSRTNE